MEFSNKLPPLSIGLEITMLAKKSVAFLVTFGTLAFAAAALAQSNSGTQSDSGTQSNTQSDATHGKSLFDRIDNFGKKIFGGIFASDKDKKNLPPATTSRAASQKSQATDLPDEDANAPRAGSILAGAGQRSAAAQKSTRETPDVTLEDSPTAAARPSEKPLKVVRRHQAGLSLIDESNVAVMPSQTIPAGPSLKVDRVASDDLGDMAALAKPARPSLHERLAGFRKSAFESDAEQDSRPQRDVQPAIQPAVQSGIASISSKAKEAKEPNPPSTVANKPGASEPRALYPIEQPMVADRTTLGVHAESSSDAAPVAHADANPAPAAANPDAASGVLIANKSPILSVETVGPRTISVGKESAYEVQIINAGEVAAENLIVFVSLPDWTEIADTQASIGAVQAAAGRQSKGAVQWKIGRLNAKSREQLTIRLIPRQSRSFDLAVRWECQPTVSQAIIEVQEPKLSLQLNGPREVLFGKKELYRLKLSNAGNGNAENVVIVLIPVGVGENVSASYKIGTLSAGEDKTLDVELTARQAGNLKIQAEARADGGLHAELVEKVLVRQAALKLHVEGAKSQFVGTVASYAVHVRNPGTAPANNVHLSIMLPTGAKYLSGIERARVNAVNAKLQWTVETLEPGAERKFLLKCCFGATGANRVQIAAVADDDLAASAETTVQVDGVANLTMGVKDPTGPVQVGDDAVYEVVLRNRGTREAQGVEVFGYFSRGIEPTATEGNPSRLVPGQVVFQPIVSLAAGEEVVLRIHAKAEVAGNHVFRAEVRCKPLSARLVSEATNLFYGGGAEGQIADESSGEKSPAPVREAMRPIPRPAQGQQPQVPPRQ